MQNDATPFEVLQRPRLRALEAIPIEHENEEFWLLRDRRGASEDAVLPREFGPLLMLLDGTRTAEEIATEFQARHGETVPPEFLENFLLQLDEALLLDSPFFQAQQKARHAEFLDSPSRPAKFAGRAYPDNAAKLAAQLDRYFEDAKGVRSNSTVLPEAIRGCIVPHIDFARGGNVEACAYASLENQKFDTLIVLGIAHSGVRFPFCLLAKDFETPLGTARCDREFCRELENKVGPQLTGEAFAHRDEHSIEFVAVFAQHQKNLRDAQIVPILCGGFFEELRSGASPAENSDVAHFALSLRELCDEWAARGKRVGIVCSVDGAHVGSNFDDDTPLSPDRLKEIEREDLVAWRCVENGDREAFHAALAKDENARNVDAHPAVYTTLLAFPEWRARLLQYDQAFSEEENSVVSFAALQLFEV